MLRLLLITTLCLVCHARSPPKCRAAPEEDTLKPNSVDILKRAPLSFSTAQKALDGREIFLPPNIGPIHSIAKRDESIARAAVSNRANVTNRDTVSDRADVPDRAVVSVRGAESARSALRRATGNIIARPTQARGCPPFTSSYAPQPLCPHARELLRTFYNSGFCYVLFPFWQRKYYTRCLCRNCRTSCRVPDIRRRNYCRPERYAYTYVWAICRSGSTWTFRNVRVRLAQGECECMSYRSSCRG